MIDLIILAVANAFIIMGISKSTYYEIDNGRITERMILWRVRKFITDKVGEFWSKPLITCPPCMASVHSTYIYWIMQPPTLHSLLLYPFYILFLSGVLSLINYNS